jgi:hypothetical protein
VREKKIAHWLTTKTNTEVTAGEVAHESASGVVNVALPELSACGAVSRSSPYLAPGLEV